jgi:dTDP-glucose 4,6-dehydratase
MKILVTGGCGFIGSAVIRHALRTTPHQIINIDKLTYAPPATHWKSACTIPAIH